MNIDKLFNRKTDKFECYEIDVFSASDAELVEISNKMGLALALPEMKNIQSYFKNKNRLPTDIELQALGQAWSEHCCYKSSKIPLKKYVFGIAEDKIVAREDAGIIDFDKDHYYCAALESHNHPSAVEPYGGAATGVGGIVRDVLCMGAQPIAYIDPLFFGPLDLPQSELPKGVKHPRFLFKGVVDGIRDYGNRIGIPTLSGQVYFHKGYTSNCLVNVGCIGILKKEELIHSWAKAPGNVYVYVGGKTGRDGIHGVTFASAELKDDSEKSSRSAVQVGDPITKEPVIHATLECNRKGLLEGLKDFGGGGLSCVSGELAYAAGFGAEIVLDDVPLKEEGLLPWEIWISESQERMMFLVAPKNVNEVLHICKQWDVTAAVVGQVIAEKITRVIYKGVKILEMDMDFFTGGPVYDTCQRPFVISTQKENIDPKFDMQNLNDILKKLLGSFNIASKEWVIRQYDHEVRGNTVIKPLQGKINFECNGDATVLKPLEESFRGLAVTANINPRFMERDPYWGACSAIDETCRNLVSVGAIPDSLLDCLNFGNPEKPEKMGEFYEACRGLGDAARELNLPYMSGNVSLYNESVKTSVPPTPQIMGIGIVPDIRKCVTSDFKKQSNYIYLVGKETDKEMGGSEYYNVIKVDGGVVPKTDINILKNYMKAILMAIDKKQIVSCHDISEGGLGVCISEMCIGGDIGAQINLSNVSKNLRSDFKLFSESNTRWVVEVEKEKQKNFEKTLKENKTPFVKIGEIKSDKIVIEDNGKKIIDQKISNLRDIWKNTIWNIMG
ncbi:MAG: phosphoribosylformylglycinamidine synthase subunit PurL [Candidatus Thermoplasmatota archaeon]|nr:phosphoribosylformylglycinamidine synthase subunit PurL [Candidatus Thermoplasmatota archaeon]